MKITTKLLMEYTIYLYLFIVMFFSNTGSIPVKTIRILIIFVFFMYVVKNRVVYLSKYCIWGLLFLVYNVFMIQYAFSKEYAVPYTITLLYVICVNVCICQYLYTNYKVIHKLIDVFIFTSLIQGAYVYITEGFLVFLNSRYIEGLSANTVGMYCAFSSVFCIYKYLENKRKQYIFWCFLSTIFMILSASRKAFLFMGIPIAFYYIVKANNPIKIFRNVLFVIAFILIVYFSLINIDFLYELVGKRIEGLLNGLLGFGEVDGSTATRLSLINFGIEWFKKKPWFGYGMSNFKALVAVYRSWGTTYYAHNNYVELLVDCGLVGTFLYYYIYFKILASGLCQVKEKNKMCVFLYGIFISIVVGEYGIVTYNHVVIQLLIMVIYMVIVERRYHVYEKDICS